jgi:hypothetical protein
MINHSKCLGRAQTIQRGKQFRYFTQGSMKGFGSREAAGGAPADAYRAYDTMSAETEHDIDILFNHAEVSLKSTN